MRWTLVSMLAPLLFAGAVPLAGQPAPEQKRVGLVPFDVSSVEGRGGDAGRVMATLVRVEMLQNPALLPELVSLPEGTKLPLATSQAAAIGKEAGVALLIVGTVLEATSTRQSNRATTHKVGGITGDIVKGASGTLTRSKADVRLHIQVIDPVTGKIDGFEVEASKTDVGVGTDFWTAMGGFSTGDNGWQDTPMGKALRQAAEKVAAEVAKRAGKS
jgi:hypothetical protein